MSILNHTLVSQQSKIDDNSLNTLPIQMNPRTKFLLFIKILFRLLERAGDELLLEQAKLAVFQCRFNASPQIVERFVVHRLQAMVGREVFAKASTLLSYYLRKQLLQQKLPTRPTSSTATQSTQKPQQDYSRRDSSTFVELCPVNGVFHNDSLILAQFEPSPITERK